MLGSLYFVSYDDGVSFDILYCNLVCKSPNLVNYGNDKWFVGMVVLRGGAINSLLRCGY